MVKLGVVLILFSFGLLLGLVFIPNLLSPLAVLYCPPGETLERSTFTFAIPNETSTSLYFHCADADGIGKHDVTAQVTVSVIGLFLIFDLSGFALTTIGGRRKRQREASDTDEHSIPRRLRTPKTGMTLAERLRQLQEARNEGLIDSDEYSRLREEALHQLE